jgi:O-antigen ligase
MSSAARLRRFAPAAAAGLWLVDVAFAVARSGQASSALLTIGVLGAGSSAAYLIWRADPAMSLSLGFALTCFSGNWSTLGLPKGGTLAPDRLLVCGGLAVILLRGPWMRDRARLRPELPHWLLALAAAFAAISAFASHTLFHQASLLRLVEAFGVIPFLVFLLAPFAFRSAASRNKLLVVMVIFGAYLAVTALFETAGLKALVVPGYINNELIGIHFGRARGPFVEAVTNGTALYGCAVGCVVAITVWRSAGARIVAGVVCVLCLCGVFLTLQRSVWVAAVVASLAAGVLVQPLRRWIAPAILVTAAALSVALLVSPSLRDKVAQRKSDIGTVDDRRNLNTAALNMIRARPLTGFGWERFVDRSIDYFQQAPNYSLSGPGFELHDIYLGYGATLGLPTTLLWLGGVLIGLGSALLTRGPPDLEPWRAGLVAVSIFILIVSAFVPPQVFPNLLLWLWTAVVWVPRLDRGTAVARARVVGAPPSPTVGTRAVTR